MNAPRRKNDLILVKWTHTHTHTKTKKQTNKHTCKWRQKLILIEVAKWDMLIEGIIKSMISNREYTNSKEYM